MSFVSDGGTGTMKVTTNPECTWLVQSGAAWVTLTPPVNGQGNGSVQFAVGANGLPSARTAVLTVEDQRLEISQQGLPCAYRLSSTAETVEATGGERTIRVTTTSPQCPWTATANVPWIAIVSGREGDDSGPVTFHVDPLSGPQRSGTLTIAGQTVDVQQGAGCSYSIGTEALTFGAAGGTSEVPVSAPAACGWTAQSGAPWIALTRGATGSGAGVVAVQVPPTDGPARSGTLTVAGRVVTVTQSPGCSVTIAPSTYTAPATASTSAAAVRTAAGCGWSAESTAEWIVVTAGPSGTGPGEVQFSVAANAGPHRVGGIRVAGQMMTIDQAAGCTVSVAPTSVSVGAGPSTNTVQVATAPGCAWSASSGEAWIALGDVTGGSGSGNVPFTVIANTGPARQGTLSIGGRTVTVSQASGCTYTVTPLSQDVGAGGGPATASISTGAGCTWSAASAAEWITPGVTSGAGPGQVSFSIAPNRGPARTGTAKVAGTVLTFNQPSPCQWVFSPPNHAFGADGGFGTVLVIVSGPCEWVAVSNVEWITITAGASGTGNGLLQFVAAPNPGAARTGSLTIAGERYVVTEAGR